MSEIKRISLTTLEPQKVSDKVNKKLCKTVRISVILPESNEDNCPEYNYKDQLAAVKKKSKQVKDTNSVENGLDPFDNDDDVRRIALEMEAKYGATPGGAYANNNKRKRKGRKDDYADIGMGYDESDSFIDNTDGYDEIIPQNVTTLHGGFYINCGALEFKTDEDASSAAESSSSSSESSDQEDQEEDATEGGAGGSGEEDKPNKSKKRVLDSSSSDSETASTSQVEKKVKLQNVKTTMHQAIKKKLFSSEKIQVKKNNPIDSLKKTVKDLLREKREDLEMTIPEELKEIGGNVERDSLKENKKPMSITSVTDAIESVVKHIVDKVNYDKNQNMQTVDVNTTDLSKNKSVTENSQTVPVNLESSQDVNTISRQEVTKLPENLPSDISELVEKIKTAGMNYKGEGKKAFFTDEVNSLLLNLERKCRVLGKSSRLRVYEYLSSFVVVCKKDTLIKRARSLIMDQEERRLKKLEVELKNKIDYVMPTLIAKFEQECQLILAKKFSKESAECEELKALKMPRRKFQWTDECRKLIKDILSFKKRCLIREGKQKDKLEEQVVLYMKTVIMPMWPEGWMYLNNLKKVYNSMASDNSKSANSCSISLHSNSLKTMTISPTIKNEVKSNLPSISDEVTVHAVKLQEAPKQPKEKPVDIFKPQPEVPKQPVNLDRHSLKPAKHKIFAENMVKAHADTSEFVKHAGEKLPIPIPSGTEDLPSDLSMPSKMFKPYADNDTKTSSETFGLESGDRPSDLSRHGYKSDKSKDFSQFEMFKPYADPNHRRKEKGKAHGEFSGVSSTPSSSKHKEGRSEGSSKNAHRLRLDIPTIFEDPTVMMKQPANQDPKKDHHSVITKASHCHGIDLSDRIRTFTSPDVFAATAHPRPSSTPKISKTDGDDIQMVMENLKALQKLSCSPIKNDNSSSSSGYNKKNGKGEDGYQDDFQKQFVSSLQQMQAGSGVPKAGFNNRCS